MQIILIYIYIYPFPRQVGVIHPDASYFANKASRVFWIWFILHLILKVDGVVPFMGKNLHI